MVSYFLFKIKAAEWDDRRNKSDAQHGRRPFLLSVCDIKHGQVGKP